MTFSHMVTAFFTKYLASERGMAANTIASYSDCMKLLIKFACKRFAIETEKLDISQFDRDLIVDFLDYLENTRNNAVLTRNQRLAAIKTFFHFLARNVPELTHLNATVQAIAKKHCASEPPICLTMPQVNAILARPDTRTVLGARDEAMVQLFHNAGARVQEAADLAITDVRFDTLPLVTLTGKGGKTRVIPLRQQTVEAITHYLKVREHAGIKSDHLFVNLKGQPMTRSGIARRIKKHAREAARFCPSLRDICVTPHVFRHTAALHLYEATHDIIQVQQWLGHEDLRTTSRYIEISIERKREALDKIPPPDCGKPPELPRWKEPELLAFLSKLSSGVMLRENG